MDPWNMDPFTLAAMRQRQNVQPLGGRREGTASFLLSNILASMAGAGVWRRLSLIPVRTDVWQEWFAVPFAVPLAVIVPYPLGAIDRVSARAFVALTLHGLD